MPESCQRPQANRKMPRGAFRRPSSAAMLWHALGRRDGEIAWRIPWWYPRSHRSEREALPVKLLHQTGRCAVVIAAGAGSRLRRTSNDDRIVKPITPLLGTPIIVRTLRTLCDEGVDEAVVVGWI